MSIGLLTCFCLPLQVVAVPAVEIDVGANPLVAPAAELVFGWQFVLSEPIEISHFGLFDGGLDGFERSWGVKIWRVGGGMSPIAGGLGDDTTLLGQFRYTRVVTQINPPMGVHLDPGEYVIAAGGLTFPTEDNQSTDLIPSGAASISTGPAITFVGARSGLNKLHDEDLVMPGTAEPGLKYFGPNFQYEIVPEPSSLTLFVLGFITILCSAKIRYRRAWHAGAWHRHT